MIRRSRQRHGVVGGDCRIGHRTLRGRALTARQVLLLVIFICSSLSGCAALTNPVAEGIPVHRLPPEVLGRPREEEIPIPLTRLRQPPPEKYKVDVGDVLGVWIESILGAKEQAPPVIPPPPGSRLNSSVGFPINVGENGTISLPYIPPINVKGMTVDEIREEIRKAYTETRQILKPGSERILVDIQRPRLYHILVIREDSGGVTVGATGILGSSKRGTGYELDLPAYQNDVLNALARTGGFPGLDAKNEVIVERGKPKKGDVVAPPISPDTTVWTPGTPSPEWGGGERIVIPLRLRTEADLPFNDKDVVLETGDVIYIEARDPEVFYTGGVLGSHQFILPRDYDLNIVDAIALANGPLVNGGFSGSNLSGVGIPTGLGTPSPRLVSIVRKMPGGRQIVIRVDLDRALRDPRERILVQAKDIIIMQENIGDAIVRYITQQVQFQLHSTLFQRQDALGTGTASGP